jgi:SAM-dependent methyltransferase
MDPIAQFKENAKIAWSSFAPTEIFTAVAAPALLRFSGIRSGAQVLDVGCGTGVLALGAARMGAHVTGVDLTAKLLERARENAAIAHVEIEWHEGDVEAMPFGDASFDIVVSQFGHMFAPRPDVAVKEMLRVLKPGGTIAFSTWPPEVFTGKMFAVIGKYAPPPPPGVAAPPQWGDPNIVRERLGSGVKDLTFDRGLLRAPTLSPQHMRVFMESNVGPVQRLVQNLTANDPGNLATLRSEFDALIASYFEDNHLRQDFLMTRATKV